jgi:hypothetical protein
LLVIGGEVICKDEPQQDAFDVVRLLRELVDRSFPRLRAIRFAVSVVDLDDCIAEVRFVLDKRLAYIWIDRTDLNRIDENALTGCLAHELCHVEADYKRGCLGKWFYDPLYWRVPCIKSWEERSVDRMAVRKGYGPQLIALHSYNDLYYESYAPKDGLTVQELTCLGG